MHVIVLKLGFKPNQCPCVVFLGKTLSAMCNFVAPLYRNVMVDKNLSRTLRQLNTFSFQFLFSKIKEKRCKKKKVIIVSIVFTVSLNCYQWWYQYQACCWDGTDEG